MHVTIRDLTPLFRTGMYPDVTGQMVQLNTGDVWKYGTSVDPAGRYPQGWLTGLNLQMNIEFRGTLPQALVAEKSKLILYATTHGYLPPGNRIFK